MFENGSLVVYGVSGVCRVESRQQMDFGTGSKEYYILVPISSDSSRIYVPVANDQLVAKMKRVMSAEEIKSLIKKLPEMEEIWDNDSSARKEKIKAILDSGDRVMQIRLIRTLYNKKLEREKNGKKLWAFEEYAMNSAEKNLYEEFAVVLGIRPDQVVKYIAGELE